MALDALLPATAEKQDQEVSVEQVRPNANVR